jgi:hypothetical protein
MSAVTLEMPAVGVTTAAAWECDLTRYALGVHVGGRIAWWRARLRLISARLQVDDNETVLSAVIAVAPSIVSVPGTAGRFMAGTRRTSHLLVRGRAAVAEGPLAFECEVSTPQETWQVALHGSLVEVDAQRCALSLNGVVPRLQGVLPTPPLHIESIAEFTRCDD